MSRRSQLHGEAGAILPIFALLIVVLIVFAAFTVDLGAAWAQRRQSQTAADAGVMAAALDYLRDSGSTETGVFNLVNDYANANLTGTDLVFADWDTCVDAGRPDDFAPLGTSGALDGDGDGTTGDVTDCISIKQVGETPAVLRVRVPDKQVPTSFARLIGVNTIAVSAFAEAEIRYLEASKVIPFALPADAGTEECLNTPPNGQLPDVTPNCGSDSGNFGFLDINWYGAEEPQANLDRSCTNDSNPPFATRTPPNVALGIDHPIAPWPDENDDGITTTATPGVYPPEYIGYDGPPIDEVVSQVDKDKVVDSCANADTGLPPTAIGTKTGNRDLLELGLFSEDAFGLGGAYPGRLRQPTPYTFPNGKMSSADTRTTLTGNGDTFDVDNVGLWEYLDFDQSGDECRFADFNGKEGRDLSDQMSNCLEEGDPFFRPEIVDSPRFAVVPVLNYTGQSGDQNWAIITLRPVYLHTMWFECKHNDSTDKWCMFEPDGFDTYVPPSSPITLTMNTPSDGALVIGDVTVSATATAASPYAVTKVEFFADGTSIGIGTATGPSSYEITWVTTAPPAKDGRVVISATATATDSSTDPDTIITGTAMIAVAVNNKGGQDAPASPARLGKSIYFNPGEGDIDPCLPDKKDEDCIQPNDRVVDGMSAFALLPEWLPESVKNALGSSSPYQVYLRK